MSDCHVCSKPLEGPIAEIVWSGFEDAKMNGKLVTVHARCLRLTTTPSAEAIAKARAGLAEMRK